MTTTAPTLRTRKPTGKIPYPLCVFEGIEGGGKTYAALTLSASPRIRNTYAMDLGEGSLDEYATLGEFDVIEHNGTYGDILDQVTAVCAIPQDLAHPDLLVIDTATGLWSLLCDEVAAETKRRNKPDATMDQWNRAKARWRAVVDPLRVWPGIVIFTARGKEVSEMENGRPAKGGSKVWKVEAEKSLVFDANVVVRFTGAGQAQITKSRSLKLVVPEGRTLPVPGFTAEKLVFELMGANKENVAPRQLTALVGEEDTIPVNAAKAAVYAAVGQDRNVAADVWAKAKLPARGAVTQAQLDEVLAAAGVVMAEVNALIAQADAAPAEPAEELASSDPDPFADFDPQADAA